MEPILREHFLRTSAYTNAGLYRDYFQSLPDEPKELGELISHQIVHRVTLREGNTNANADLRYGDMNRFPWHRHRCDDDIFLTAPAIAAELFRLDGRGFVPDRAVENKLILTCRYVSVLVCAIYKAKGIPCRSRAGFAPYFWPGVSADHWINQVWSEADGRWITFDADGRIRLSRAVDEGTLRALGIRKDMRLRTPFDFEKSRRYLQYHWAEFEKRNRG